MPEARSARIPPMPEHGVLGEADLPVAHVQAGVIHRSTREFSGRSVSSRYSGTRPDVDPPDLGDHLLAAAPAR